MKSKILLAILGMALLAPTAQAGTLTYTDGRGGWKSTMCATPNRPLAVCVALKRSKPSAAMLAPSLQTGRWPLASTGRTPKDSINSAAPFGTTSQPRPACATACTFNK